MKIKIYQINMDRDKNHVKFSRHELLEKYQGTSAIDASLYDEVFSGEVECSDLEGVYTAFNTQPQPLHRGHSLSVSDIVVNEDGAYFCDSFGFKKVDFDESQAQKPDNLLKIVYVEPHKAPVIAEIEDTSFAFQRAVLGGFEEFWNENGTVPDAFGIQGAIYALWSSIRSGWRYSVVTLYFKRASISFFCSVLLPIFS